MARPSPTQTGPDAGPGTAVLPLQAPHPRIPSSDCLLLGAVEVSCGVAVVGAVGATGPQTEAVAVPPTTTEGIATPGVAPRKGDGVETETSATAATDIPPNLMCDETLATNERGASAT